LVEIAPDVVHPVFGKKLSALFFKEKKEDSK